MEAIQLGPVMIPGSPAGAWQQGPHQCPGRAAGALQSPGLSLLPSQRLWLLAQAQHSGCSGTSNGPCLLLASLRLEPGEGGGSSSSGDQKLTLGFATHASRTRHTHKQPLLLLSTRQLSSRYTSFMLNFVYKTFPPFCMDFGPFGTSHRWLASSRYGCVLKCRAEQGARQHACIISISLGAVAGKSPQREPLLL